MIWPVHTRSRGLLVHLVEFVGEDSMQASARRDRSRVGEARGSEQDFAGQARGQEYDGTAGYEL